ncbi:MAG: MarP family serine protease [Actinobacteria bacterium]|nr:MarP family serine protease [Actinomycetota bacterium]
MNLLDVLLLLSLVSALAVGYRLGFVTRVASWVGLAVGIVAASLVLPTILRTFANGDAFSRLLITLFTYVLVAALGGSAGEAVGYSVRRRIPTGGLRTVDRAGGAGVGVIGVLIVVWLIAPIAAEVPGPASRFVRNSAVVQWVDDLAPAPPGPIVALRKQVAQTRFPEVFAGLQPAPQIGAPPAQLPLSAEQLDRVVSASVAVESVGCGAVHEGSGFIVAPRTVVTNAHVVAGSTDLTIKRPTGETFSGQVVVFDDDRDLAVLDVPGLDGPALSIGDGPPGTQGAVVGYPGGQDEPRPVPASIEDDRLAVGRDIYGRDRVERRILFLAANLAQGDSGSAVVDANGVVVGVSFAIAPDQPDVAYALDEQELQAVLQLPRDDAPGPCV